jgi:hypothetical protein
MRGKALCVRKLQDKKACRYISMVTSATTRRSVILKFIQLFALRKNSPVSTGLKFEWAPEQEWADWDFSLSGNRTLCLPVRSYSLVTHTHTHTHKLTNSVAPEPEGSSPHAQKPATHARMHTRAPARAQRGQQKLVSFTRETKILLARHFLNKRNRHKQLSANNWLQLTFTIRSRHHLQLLASPTCRYSGNGAKRQITLAVMNKNKGRIEFHSDRLPTYRLSNSSVSLYQRP